MALNKNFGGVACASVLAIIALAGTSDVAGQGQGRGGQGRGGPPAAPQTAKQAAPVDITGTWVSIVSEDWRWRMVTPPKGDVSSIPVNGEARKVAASWNLEADNTSGNQCKAYGIGGIIRQPGRLRISWQDDQTLKLEFDAGTQTRVLNFDRSKQAPAEKTLQGFSIAQWEGPGVGRGAGPAGDGRQDPRVTGGGLLDRGVPGGGGGGLRGGPPPRQQNQIASGGDLRVVTTNFREGYLRKNGVPYSEQASITEYFHRLPTHPNGDVWLHVITAIDDPRYLTQTFYTSTSFRREASDASFKPSACTTAVPLPVKAAK
jgi:hypothetical protein